MFRGCLNVFDYQINFNRFYFSIKLGKREAVESFFSSVTWLYILNIISISVCPNRSCFFSDVFASNCRESVSVAEIRDKLFFKSHYDI